MCGLLHSVGYPYLIISYIFRPSEVISTLRRQHAYMFQVGVIGNLVHSSVNIKKEVLNAGALQPVIGLLRYASI